MINYYKLFDKLNRKGMSKTELRLKAHFSTVTLTRLSKNENVSIDIINKICNVLDCQPGDLLEFVPDDPDVELK